MSNTRPHVIIFDSGVGGLSVFTEISRQLPGCELTFVSDAAGFPYGIRSEADLIDRVEKVVAKLVGELQPDILVIACNSASTVVLPIIRPQYEIPFVGVVPAIKPAAALSKNRSIGLLATPATISRAYTQQLVREFAADCKVIPIGSSELVYLAEAKLRGKSIATEKVAEIIAPFFESAHQPELDTVVLACTHFPLILEELKLAAPRPIHWIDSSAAIARRVQSLLGDRIDKNLPTMPHSAVFTGLMEIDPFLGKTLSQLGILNVANMDI